MQMKVLRVDVEGTDRLVILRQAEMPFQYFDSITTLRRAGLFSSLSAEKPMVDGILAPYCFSSEGNHLGPLTLP